MPSTIDAIRTEMDSIAAASDLTDDLMSRYEDLEKELRTAQKADEILKRNAAYNTVTAPIVSASAKPADTLDRAFEHYLRTGKENQDITELRAQGSTGSAGGYMIPDGFRNKLVDRMVAFGGVANAVETIVTDAGNPVEWPTLNDTGNVGEIVGEGGTFAAGADLTFGTASLGAYKYMAGGATNLPLRVSVELLQDSAFDVQALVSSKLGERIARIQAQHIVRGDGSGEPLGLVHGLTGVKLGDGSVLTYDSLVDAMHTVDPSYRDGAVWAFNDATLAEIKKIKDSHGDPIWRPSTADMATGTGGGSLLGHPVVIDQAFLNYAPADEAVNFGAFGNLREGYVIRRVQDITIVVNPYSRAANGQVEFSAWARMDATQQNTNAYVALSGNDES